LAVMPNNEDAIGARAKANLDMKNIEEAKKDWQKLCEMQPNNPSYWYGLAMVDAIKGDTASALTHFRKVLDLKPDFIAAVKDILFLYVKDKKLDAALAELDRLSQSKTPQDAIHELRGEVYLAQKNAAAAEQEWRKTIELNPQNYQAYVMLGMLKRMQNQLPQAIKEIDQLIARNDKLPQAYILKSQYLTQSKDTSGAIENLRKALKLDPENPIASNDLAWIFCETNSNLEEALSLAKTAKKKFPEDVEISDTLGWVYYKMKNYALAIDQLSFSLNNRKQPAAENYYRLGMAQYAKGDILQAKQNLKKSLALNPKFEGAEEARKILKSSS
jgi:tetratricopeptide (TPR) repeat protein